MRDAQIQYSPLARNSDGIRLFFLHPGSDDDLVSGTLECRGLGQIENSFEALSYVWGRTDDNTTILVDDRFVSVTKSLETALRHLRFQDRPRTLRIDYICINQCDVQERNHQVGNMGRIYEIASSVLIWLGEATPDTVVGMKVLGYFANEPRPEPHPVWQDYPSFIVQAGLLDVMSRSWFQLIWVAQEAGRSRNINLICGRHEVKWQSNDCIAVQHFMKMIKYAELLPQWDQMGLRMVNMQPLLDMLDLQIGNQLDRSWGVTHRSAPDILDVAYNMRHRLCVDPRDKVFGILGLVEHMWELDNFKPDYSMTEGQIYEVLASILAAFR
ncbi:heterokaryon incompatibility protein-domain-containing protein [Phaeosphaeriaceae sp. PMI808]|nr:heterokaryon incompatibility protein-domain-containing protein [Phaeosphaeriaceae sp. PMI808]